MNPIKYKYYCIETSCISPLPTYCLKTSQWPMNTIQLKQIQEIFRSWNIPIEKAYSWTRGLFLNCNGQPSLFPTTTLPAYIFSITSTWSGKTQLAIPSQNSIEAILTYNFKTGFVCLKTPKYVPLYKQTHKQPWVYFWITIPSWSHSLLLVQKSQLSSNLKFQFV